jgi:WS/DGAT/MGAT family acyltransferase
MDAAFLYGETANAPLNVIATVVLEPTSLEPAPDFERLRAQIESRLPAIPILRDKLVEVPLGLDHPGWIPDAQFDLDDHVHRAALRPPGGERELSRFVARLAETPLRRDRPLWEIHVVEGLSGGRFALVAKMHHAAVDGIAGVGVLAGLLDRDPDGKQLVPSTAPPEVPDVPVPSSLGLLGDAALALGGRPLRGVQQLFRSGGAGARLLYSAIRRDPAIPPAPSTPLNGPISSRRSIATGSVSLDDVKAIKRRYAATVNHVVLAACAGALRNYLTVDGEPPGEPLVAAVPMALEHRGSAANALSVLLVRLPVHLARAADRLAASREASLEARRIHEEIAPQLGDWADLCTPALFAGASQLYHRLGLAALHSPIHNVTISNVPGPPETLWCAGARVASCHPFGPIYDGWGLNLTVMSYANRLGIGAVACSERVPDLERIPRSFEESVAQLRRAAA